MIENALILAAGRGTRMWPLTENIPKPLLPISGVPIIKRHIDELKKVGVKKVYILIGYQMNEISDYIDKTETEIEVNYIIQEKQKGTGHAVKMAENNFRILLGDKGIDVVNSKMHATGVDPYDFFSNMNVENDASHAFYLGVELARAQIACQLGKNYDQDNEIWWGVASEKNKENLLQRPKLKITQKTK